MDKPLPTAKPDPHRLQQAAEWFVVLSDHNSSATEQSEWQGWINSDPENQLAWNYVERVNKKFRCIESSQQQSRAYNALSSAQDVALSRRRSLKLLSFAALAGLGGWLSLRHTPLGIPLENALADYSSELGEIKPLVLADQSKVWLNTNSAINVALGPQQRTLTLVRGEVLIQTASGDLPNFTVQTEQGRLRALGTRFAVDISGENSRLTVYEGAVELICSDSGDKTVVQAGEQIEYNAISYSKTTKAQAAHEAWSAGRLIADTMSLGDFIKQVERYHPHLILVTEAAADILVVGSFPANDLNTILSMLEESLPIKIERQLPWLIQIKV